VVPSHGWFVARVDRGVTFIWKVGVQKIVSCAPQVWNFFLTFSIQNGAFSAIFVTKIALTANWRINLVSFFGEDIKLTTFRIKLCHACLRRGRGDTRTPHSKSGGYAYPPPPHTHILRPYVLIGSSSRTCRLQRSTSSCDCFSCSRSAVNSSVSPWTSVTSPRWPLDPAFYKQQRKRLGTCYSASYVSQTRDQKRFTISEVAADWHELMIPQRTMRPSIARVRIWSQISLERIKQSTSGKLDPRLHLADIPPPQSATQGLHPIAVSYYSFLVPLRIGGCVSSHRYTINNENVGAVQWLIF